MRSVPNTQVNFISNHDEYFNVLLHASLLKESLHRIIVCLNWRYAKNGGFMSSALGPRHFAKIVSLLVLVFLGFYPQTSEGKAAIGNCTNAIVDWEKKGTGSNSYRRWIDPSFSSAEKDLIEKALRIAVNRIQKKSNWEQIKDLYTYAWITSDSLASSGICNGADMRQNLLFNQLYWLSVPNGKNDTAQPFPDIYIRKGYEQTTKGYTGWVARAPYDTVKIFWDWDIKEWRLSDDSKFEITLNNYYVNAGRIYSDPEYWAGTIAHEMGHNLGHR
ncbi:MAG: hypothetical protein WCD76_01385, partial [Pyrinomonadaceae bacterium]